MKDQLILLHGAIGSAEQFSPLASRLRADFDVHVPDLPGHGDRALNGQPFAFSTFVSSMADYIAEQGLKQPLVFGHSMGGVVAMLLALEQPRLLRGLITLGTKLVWTPEVAQREVGYLNPEKVEQKVPAFAWALEQRHRALSWKTLLSYTQEFTIALGEQPPLPLERLSALSLPVFYGVAEGDHLVPLAEAQQVVTHLPQGEVWTVPGAHPLESVDADALAEKIRGLAASLINPERSPS